MKDRLRLTAAILADIYRGKITEWDDPLIRDANPRVPLPKKHVTPMCLSDVSGSTAIFNDYLSKAVASWHSRLLLLSSGRRLACSISASDAQAVARVKQTPGAIGYADVSFTFNRVSVANILNRTDHAVEPDSETLHAAAVNSSTQIPQDLRMSITDATGRDSYPIASYSYMVLYERQANRATGTALIKFLTWVLHDGQNYAAQMHYGTLPAPLVKMEQLQLNQIELPSIEQ